MGQLFDKAIRRGFSDIFDSAYGTSALENRLKGALASSLYDARLSSSGYNQARTKTVESELANRESLRGRLVEGGDANALDRFDIGPGHSQDYMKGQVGQAKEDRLVKELENLAGGNERDIRTRSGTILGSTIGSIGTGQKAEVGAQIDRETQDALTAALATMKSADRSTPAGEKIHQDAMTEALMLTGESGNLSSISQIESKIGANVALKEQREAKGLASLGSMESQRQYREDKIRIQEEFNSGRLDIGKIKATAYADWKSAESLLANEKMQVQKAKVHEIEISALLKENKIDKVKAEIQNANSKTNAEIKRIDQLVSSGEIKDLEVRENTRLIGERMKTEVKKREKMGATIDKLHKEGEKIDAMIDKIRAQTKGEEVDIGLALLEFLGVDTKSASGDSLRNNYTKMYVKIMEEDPILREIDPATGQERDQILEGSQTDDNPEGQKKLFSHLDADNQKAYIQSRLIDERQESYAMTGKTLHPKVQELVDGMMESFTKPGEAITSELSNMTDGVKKSTAYATAPKDAQNKMRANMSVPQDRISGLPGAAASAQSLMPPPAGDISDADADMAAALSGGATAGAQATQPVVQDVPVQDNVPAALGDLQNQQVPVQGADLGADQAQAFKREAVTVLKTAGFPPPAIEFISESLIGGVLDQNELQRMMKNPITDNKKLLKASKANPELISKHLQQVLESVIEWQKNNLGLTNALQGQ